VLLALALTLRLPLLLAYPGIYGGDSVARLAHSDQLVLAYQLPLPQLLVFLIRAVLPDPFWTRLAFALIGALLAPALARVVRGVWGVSAGRAAGVLAAVHPLLAYYSLVPYQESLMLLLLLHGAAALQAQQTARGSVALGLACLCRYEAWFAAALAMVAHRRRTWRAALLFGWAPLLWIAVWGGLSPAGTYVLDVDPAAGRLARMPFLLGKLREYSGSALCLLAAAGLGVALWRRNRRAAWGAAYVALALLSIVAAGHEFPPGSGRVSERLIHIPVVAMCALAGLAVGALAEGRPAVLRGALAASILAVVGLSAARRTEALVAEANRDPDVLLAQSVAAFAGPRVSNGDHLAVAAPIVGIDAIEAYVQKVARSGGDADTARRIGRELARRAPDADRVAAHLPRPPGTVVAPEDTRARWIAVYDDAPEAASWRSGPAVARFAEGARGVTVYARPE
jgi:hypothetical protein